MIFLGFDKGGKIDMALLQHVYIRAAIDRSTAGRPELGTFGIFEIFQF